MKINQRLLSVGAFALLLGFTSCDDDDKKSGNQLSKSEAKAALADFNTSAKGDLQALADAEGLQAVQDFFELTSADDPFGRIGTDEKKVRAFFQQKGRQFRSVFAPLAAKGGRTNGSEPFDFEANTGVYSWSDVDEEFVKVSDDEIIRINFPTEGSQENNAQLRLIEYDEVAVEDSETGEVYYEPSLLSASIYVDDSKVASIELDVDYDDLGFPVAADIALSIDPYTATVSFDVSSATASTLSVGLLEGTETLLGTSITVNYKDASKSEASLKSINGHVQFKNLKLQGIVEADKVNNGGDFNLNDLVELALYTGTEKIGDIVFVTENGQDVAYIQYADGSREKLEEVLQPVIDEINALNEDLQTNG